jgi:TP901 family phage tail tape measure protein
MNSLLRIRIRVAVEQATQLAKLTNQISGIGTKARASQGGVTSMNAALKTSTSHLRGMHSALTSVGPRLTEMGKSVQWTGRQLEYNFTLPLVRAGRAIAGMMLENEKAITRLIKVYDSGGDAANRLSSQFINMGIQLQGVNRAGMTQAQQDSYDLGRSFRALSDIFGVTIDKVSELGAMWAATGAQGRDLAVAVRTTMEAMVLGDFTDAEDAFKSLIAIQQGFQLTMNQTRSAMAAINQVENITAASFQDLTAAIARSAGTARTVGVDLQHLAAMAAALVPATGSAESAGNALKTMLSRIIAPTQDAIDVMNAMGVEFNSAAFQSLNASERLEVMAENFDTLTSAQKGVVSSFVAGRYQLNRFDVLMADIINKQGTYHTVLNSLSDGLGENSRAMNQYRSEIGLFLASTPQGLAIMQTRIKNAAMTIVSQILPAGLAMMKMLTQLAQRFAQLDPGLQKLIAIGLVALAAVGPVLRLAGSFKILTGVVITAAQALIGLLGVAGKGLLAALTNPWVLLAIAIAAAATAVYIFRDDIMEALGDLPPWVEKVFTSIGRFIIRVFNLLPQGVQNALRNMVQVVANAAMQVYEWLQWMNPFATHSPSLVDSVIAGVNIIAARYASLRGIGQVFSDAAANLREFTRASQEAQRAAGTSEQQTIRQDVSVNMPSALPALDNLFQSINALKANMASIEAVMNDQESVIKSLEADYDALGRAVDAASDKLDQLKDHSASLKDQLAAAQDELDTFANAPIQGMRAMSDAIFENEMAQKRLRLAMMDMEDATGPLDDIKNKMALLAGEIEQMRGIQEDLRQAGAGSEITGPLNDQIDLLRQQQNALEDQAKPLQDMQDELDRLQRAGERLDLMNSLQFDPLTRQIDQLANGLKELPFDQIMAGIQGTKDRITGLTAAYDQAEAAVNAQQLVVDNLKSSKDALNAQLDLEKSKLDDLNDSYQAYRDLLSDSEQALNDLSSAARKAAADKDASASAAEELFDLAGTGDFEPGDMPLDPIPSDPGTLKDLADEWLKEADAAFSGVDIFKPIKDLWGKFTNWWDETVVPAIKPLWDKVKGAFEGVSLSNPFAGTDFDLGGIIQPIMDEANEKFGRGLEQIKNQWRTLTTSPLWGDIASRLDEAWTNVKKVLDIAKDGIVGVTSVIAQKLSTWGDLAAPAAEALGNIVSAVSAAFAAILLVVGGTFDLILMAWNAFAPILLPLFQIFWDTLQGIVSGVMDIIHGVIVTILAIINGDWSAAWEGIKEILGGVWQIMAAIVDAGWEQIKLFFRLGLSVIKGVWEELKGSFSATWNWITTKISELKGIVMRIPEFLRGAVTDAVNAVTGMGNKMWDVMKSGFNFMRDQVAGIVDSIKNMVNNLPGYLNTAATNLLSAAKNIGINIMNGITSGLSGAWGFAGDIATATWNALKGTYNNMITTIQNGVNRAINSLPWPLDNIPGVNLNWLKFHQGGMVPGLRGTEVPAILQAGEAVLSLAAVRELQRTGLVQNNAGMMSEQDSSRGDVTIINVNGDLSFPNISDGNDAKDFIRNLKSLVPA